MGYSFTDLKSSTSSFSQDVIDGLTQQPKRIASMYLYDKKGSELFEQICELEEYYLTRTELTILNQYAKQIAASLPENCAIIEYGSGNDQKISRILQASDSIEYYMPIDISKQFLLETSKSLSERLPEIHIHAICANYLQLNPEQIQRSVQAYNPVVFFPGSTIGNLNTDEMKQLLINTLDIIGDQGKMILGIDLHKSEKILIKAYNDKQQVTASFNVNLIDRLSKELNADVNKDDFEHLAPYNKDEQRIEMHLRAKKDLDFYIEEHKISLKKGETIHTECSHKYDLTEFKTFLDEVGMEIGQTFLDEKKYFAVLLLKRKLD